MRQSEEKGKHAKNPDTMPIIWYPTTSVSKNTIIVNN
jgi:hypothetical protein